MIIARKLCAAFVLAAALAGCGTTTLTDCNLVFDVPAPNATLKCAEQSIPMTNVAPWLRECAKAKAQFVTPAPVTP